MVVENIAKTVFYDRLKKKIDQDRYRYIPIYYIAIIKIIVLF